MNSSFALPVRARAHGHISIIRTRPHHLPAVHQTSGRQLDAVLHFLNDRKWLDLGCIIFSQYFDTASWRVDGLYGPMTRNAVERLQIKLGLKVDGWAGEITKAAIAAALAKLA